MGLLVAITTFAGIWAFEYRQNRTGTIGDLLWVTLFILWIQPNILWPPVSHILHHLVEKQFLCQQCWAVLFVIHEISTRVYGFRYLSRIQEHLEEKSSGPERGKTEYDDTSNPLKPLIFPCRTSHTRIFPKKHSFSYSYLYVGIPIGWRGSVGSLLSTDLISLPRKGRVPDKDWLSVESADHLSRGDNVHGLQGKLDEYLRSQVGVLYIFVMP